MERYDFTADQRALLEGLSQPFAIYQFSEKRVVTLILSDGFCELFGYDDRAQAYFDMDNDMYKDTHPDDVARIADDAYRFATEGDTYEVVYRTKTKGSDSYRIVHAMGKHVYTEEGVRLAHVWYTDEGPFEGDGQETALNRMFSNALREESLVRTSNYDYLTGLPSMTYFFELAEEGRRSIWEKGGQPVLLYMDLSGMKYFNTQYSFAVGDKLLIAFAKALKSTFSNESCCRIGSDHFAAFTEESKVEDTLNEFFATCRDINDGNNLPVRVGIYPGSLEDVPASTACDRAKFACDSLRNMYESCFAYYDSGLRDDAERRRYVVANVDKAITEKWIQVHYQPIIRAVNGRVCEEEALSRWFDPKYGLLPPNDFVPALEDSGSIFKLDLYVLEQVLEKMKGEGAMGLEVVPHSINLSRSDFASCDIVEEVRKRVDEAGIGRDKISIEVTESTVGSDFEFMKEQLGRFRNLGFPVWMDDFGSGYSSIDFLQSMQFDLIKFDMSFMKRLDEGDDGKIVLTELMKMATALGAETVCEGVETEGQVRFLQEIGCSKLQGFFFCRPIPLEDIVERYEKGIQVGYENPQESFYYDAIGRVNLYDLAIITNEGDGEFRNYFNTLPMCIMEVDSDTVEFVRTNQSYRDFAKRFFGFDLEHKASDDWSGPINRTSGFMQMVQQCCDKGSRAFFDETMPDGSIVHSFVRQIATNDVTGKKAAVIAVLSISESNEGATYAGIARALAADYYNIYYVDLDTEKFIEYSSQVGGEELAMERHGEDFFESAKRDTMTRIYGGDRELFLSNFTKENIVRELDKQGVFTITYRLMDSGEPVYVNMKVTRMNPGANQIIIGISVVDSQMKQRELVARMRRERDVLSRAIALSGNYLSMYTIEPETGRFFEYSVTDEFETLGIAKEGDDFFAQGIENAQHVIHPDDLPEFLKWFSKENILREVRENGTCTCSYRLLIGGNPTNVSLRIAKVMESDGEKLVAGVRAWQPRKTG